MVTRKILLFCILSFLLPIASSISMSKETPQSIKTLPKSNMYVNTKGPIPQYQATFNIPAQCGDVHASVCALVLRFYQAFGDGSSTGWQTAITPPKIMLENQQITPKITFDYSNYYEYGPLYDGYDQYAQYLVALLPVQYTPVTLTVTGSYQQIAYMSATVYSGNSKEQTQQEIVDKEMVTINNGSNPYIEGNPSVFSYPAGTTQTLTKNINTPKAMSLKLLKNGFVDTNTGKINVYRLDQTTTKQNVVDEIAPDGCSQGYLVAQKNPEQEVIILRIKIPTTFISNNAPDKIFGHYQTDYFSVSANRTSADDDSDLLTYWTVNARMLNDFADKDGYAYVFFAPNSYTNSIALQQKTPPTQPPVMIWGQYKGYLLGNPDYAIILRYRDSDPAWQGNPKNAKCYTSPLNLRPVTTRELGIYTPEIYGDTLQNFLNGNIGIVNKNAAWPKKRRR